MVNLKIQKRLAADLLKCGKRRIWMDPQEAAEIHTASNSMFLSNVNSLSAE